MSKLETIEGIGPAISEKLEAAGLKSVASLLESGATKKGRGALAEKTGIAELKILKLVNHADLMRVKGVGGEYAELLEASGVDSVAELAQRNAANLVEKMTSVNAEKKLVRALPSLKQAEGWIQQAASLPKVVQH
jgi:predicted flap endonuclease-1-like 5' DNA nuclease